MVLSPEQRVAIVFLYHQRNLHWVKNRCGKLQSLCLKRNIQASVRTIRKIIKRWHTYRTIADSNTVLRSIHKTKVTRRILLRIERMVKEDRGITAPQIQRRLRLDVTTRTMQNYIHRVLGRKTTT